MLIFISRALAEGSIFRQSLEEKGHRVIGESFLQFVAVPFTVPPPVDWIFAYSPRGVRFFLAGLRQKKHSLPNLQKWAAIGPGTAQAMQELGISVSFTGNGEAATTADTFLKLAEGQKVLFPQAKDSRQSVEKCLKGRVERIPLIVYESHLRDTVTIPPAQILVFTSPRNAQAYYQQYPPQANQSVVAIGQPTRDALTDLGLTDVHMAKEPSEKGLLDTVLSLVE